MGGLDYTIKTKINPAKFHCAIIKSDEYREQQIGGQNYAG